MISLENLQGDRRVLDGSNDTTVVQVEDMVFFLEDLWGVIQTQVRPRQGQQSLVGGEPALCLTLPFPPTA